MCDTITIGTRHPFLDDLADDVKMITNVTNDEVVGKEHVLRVVGAASQIYRSQTNHRMHSVAEGQTLLEYDAEIVGGRVLHGTVVIQRNAAGSVSHLNIGFAPLGGALSFALQLGQILADGKKYGTI